LKKFIIESIRNHDGTDKTDGKNPQRVGSVVTMLDTNIAQPLSYAYISDAAGEAKEGTFTGGTVTEAKINQDSQSIKIITSGSIYKFLYCGEYRGDSDYVNGLLSAKCGGSSLKESVFRTGVSDITSVDLDTLLKNFR
jgi:hypothetical protein